MNDDPDDLRHRLYRPGATLEDVARYRATSGDDDRVPADGPLPVATPPDRPRRRALLVGLAGAAVVVLAGVGIAVTARIRPAPPPRLAPPPAAVSLDDTQLTIPATVRAAFVASLDEGASADLLHYIFENPDARPAQLRTVTRADSTEHWGSGAAEVSLSPSQEAEHGGRLTVAVIVNRAASVRMTAVRADSGNSPSFIERLDTGGGVHATPGLPAVRTVLYGGEAPTDLTLSVPRGVHWDVVIVFSD